MFFKALVLQRIYGPQCILTILAELWKKILFSKVLATKWKSRFEDKIVTIFFLLIHDLNVVLL